MMNFGNFGVLGVLFALLLWCLPLVLLVWFLKTLGDIARSLREIAARLEALERAVRDAAPGGR